MSTPTPVFLNVYDLHRYNKWAYHLGLGAFHAGVELRGSEWSFGFMDSSETGVFSNEPRTAPSAVFRESILMGYTNLSPAQIDAAIETLERQFPGNSYHMLTRNCTTFCDEMVFALTGRRIPGWVNRLAWVASCVDCVLPRGLRGPIPTDDGTTYIDTETTPILQPPMPQSFPGAGVRLGSSSAPTAEVGFAYDDGAYSRREDSSSSIAVEKAANAVVMADDNAIQRREKMLDAATRRLS